MVGFDFMSTIAGFTYLTLMVFSLRCPDNASRNPRRAMRGVRNLRRRQPPAVGLTR